MPWKKLLPKALPWSTCNLGRRCSMKETFANCILTQFSYLLLQGSEVSYSLLSISVNRGSDYRLVPSQPVEHVQSPSWSGQTQSTTINATFGLTSTSTPRNVVTIPSTPSNDTLFLFARLTNSLFPARDVRV